MTATTISTRVVLTIVGLAVALGISTGWLLGSAPMPTLDYVRALLGPAVLAFMCVTALRSSSRRARWLVPLILLTSVLIDLLVDPRVPSLSALGSMAAVVAAVAAVAQRKHLACAGTVLCYACISASMLIGLSAR